MKICSIDYTNSNLYVNKLSKHANKNFCQQKTEPDTVFQYYTNLEQKYNVNFNGYCLKELSNKELKQLKHNVISQAKKYGINLGNDNIARTAFKDGYILQLADYLLNHTAIKNKGVRDSFENIHKAVYIDSGKNHNFANSKHTFDIDYPLLKSNCEAIMDFADYISKSSIYSNLEVGKFLHTMFSVVRTNNVSIRKMKIDYLETHMYRLEEIALEIWNDLISDNGLKYRWPWDVDFCAKLS